MIGLDGKEKDDETEVTSKASVNTTEPISLKTSIEPTYVLPLLSSEGNKVKVLLPDSLTVTSKSVPLTETEAVGVVILIFSLLFLMFLGQHIVELIGLYLIMD